MRQLFLNRIYLILMILGTGIAASAQQGQAIFSTGEQAVSAREFLQDHPEAIYLDDTATLCQAIRNYADFRTEVCEARRLRLDTTAQYRKAMQYARQRCLDRQILGGRESRMMIGYIMDHSQYQYLVSYIRVDISANNYSDTSTAYRKASRIRDMIQEGRDMETLARQLSDDPSAKYNGGYLGWVSPIDFGAGYDVHGYIYSHHSDGTSISRPIRSGNSYYVIRLGGRRGAIDTVTISPIMIRKRMRARINDSLRKLAADIVEQLGTGKSFDALQLEYSDIKFSETLPLAKAYAKYSTHLMDPADNERYTKLIETPDYYLIARIDQRHALQPNNAYRRLVADRMPGSMLHQELHVRYMDSIRDASNYQMQGNLSVICRMMPDSAVFDAQWEPGSLRNLQQTLFTYGGQAYTYADFAQYIQATQYRTGYGKIPAYVGQRYADYLDMLNTRQAYSSIEGSPEYREWMESYSRMALGELLRSTPEYPRGNPGMEQAAQYYRASGMAISSGNVILMRLYDYQSDANRKKAQKVAEALAQGSGISVPFVTQAENGTYSIGQHPIADRIIDGINSKTYRMPADRVIFLDDIHSFAIVDVLRNPEPIPYSDLQDLVAPLIIHHERDIWIEGLREKHQLSIDPDACKMVREGGKWKE